MATQTNAPLPEGLDVGGYRIARRIASGGFSIVYLAHDAAGQPVALKEYLPAALVTRAPGELVPVVAPRHLPTYQHGLRCFFEEGRSLARIFHPNVVRVLNFLRANETVYMVMAWEQGRSLQDLIIGHRDKPGREVVPEPIVLSLFDQVMNGLREVHANRMLHLDLKPANVYLREDGSPILLDFGAARQTLSDDTQRLFPMYTPGFAAPELYRKQPGLGPWTDLYGLGGTILAALTGTPPQAADKRAKGDRLDEVLHALQPSYSQALIDAVDWCLKLDPLQRPQSVFALQRALRGSRPMSLPPVPLAPTGRPTRLERWLAALVPGRRGGTRDKAVRSTAAGKASS